MPGAFSEDELVERSAIALFVSLNWQTLSARAEVFGFDGTLGRETRNEAVLLSRLKTALEALNPNLPAEAISAAIEELTRSRVAMSAVAANRELYGLLKAGIPVSITDREHGGQRPERVNVINWTDATKNDFLLVSQMTINGALYSRRPDLIGFVNGLPLVLIELKAPGEPARRGFDDNLRAYKNEIPQLFWANAVLISSNGTDGRVGSLTAD